MANITALAAGHANASRDRFLKTLSHVPDDKLNWSPAPGATTPIQIAAHVAGAERFFLPVLRGEKPVHEDSASDATIGRDALVAQINAGTNAIIAAIEALAEERLDEILELGWATMPMAAFILMPSGHLDEHAAQIDYLQLCWGDREFHF